jgi:hypothetical protein
VKSAEFLDAIKEKYGIKTDYRLSRILKISPSRISMYRSSTREFDEDTCKLVAIELNETVEFLLAEIQAVRSVRTKHEAAWRRLARVARKARRCAKRQRREK